MPIDERLLKRLRVLGMCEGTSTLVLFGIAMPLKYWAGYPLAVTIVGSLHGFLFIWLVLMFVYAIPRIPISRGLALAGVLGAIVPFGPFVVDHWLGKIGR